MGEKNATEIFPKDVEIMYGHLNHFAEDFGDMPRRLREPRNVFMLIYIHQGHGHCLVDNQYIELREGSLLLIHPFAYLHLTDVRFVLGNVVLFTEEYFCRTHLHESLLYRSAFDPNRKTFFQIKETPAAKSFLKNSFRVFGREFRFGKDEEVRQRILVCLLYGFILYLHKLQLESEGRTYDLEALPEKDKVVDFIRLVNRHFEKEHGLDFYAAKLFVSAKALTAICKKGIGMPAKDIIQDIIMAEAKRLLVYSNDSIEHISHQLGYGQASSFNKFFIRQAGLSPAAYREETLQNRPLKYRSNLTDAL